MTDNEAEVVAGIVATADGECHVCAGALARQLAKALPEYDWVTLVADAGPWEREEIDA